MASCTLRTRVGRAPISGERFATLPLRSLRTATVGVVVALAGAVVVPAPPNLSSAGRARVERVAQPVAEELEGEEQRRQNRRRDRQPAPLDADKGEVVLDQQSEAGGGRAQTDADEGEGRLRDDRTRDQERCFHNHRTHRVRQQVPEHSAPGRGSDRLGGDRKLRLPERQQLAPDEPRCGWPCGERDGEEQQQYLRLNAQDAPNPED